VTLIQAGFPNKRVRTLDGASRLILRRHKTGGSRTARVHDEPKHRFYVIEVTTCSRERRRRT
jgi:hypothetical protein